MPPIPIFCKLTFYWDNGQVESRNVCKDFIKEAPGWIIIEEAGTRDAYNLQYARRVSSVEM